MSGRFVRASKFRHVFGQPTRKDATYDNLRISNNAWDTNLVKVNPEYLAVNWEAGGGGAFAVIPLKERGRLPEILPLFRGHTAPVLDTDWNPFNDRVIASASDDGKVFIWEVPEDFTLHTDAEEPQDVAPVSKLAGHSRKVGQVQFNPAAENILASASGDLSIKIWDIGAGASSLALKHNDIVQSLSWSADGNLMVTTSRDKKLRIWDVRQERAAHVVPGHTGAKNSRAVWMGEHNRVATTGFSKMSDRQIALWDAGSPSEPIGGFSLLDSGSGVCMPFWDEGTKCLYLAGKGDGNIRYFEYENDKLEFLSEYKSGDPQRGMAFMPRRGLNVHGNEVMRAYKTVNDTYIEPISFIVPRRAEGFQPDIYPPAMGPKPGLSANEWLSGKTALAPKIDLESVFEGKKPAEVPADWKPATPAPAPVPAKTSAPAEKEKEKEPEPAPVAQKAPPPTAHQQKGSIAEMASKFQDDDEAGGKDDDDASSFEEITKPVVRTAVKPPSKPASPKPPSPKVASPLPAEPAPVTTSSQAKPVPSPVPIKKAMDPVAPPANNLADKSLNESVGEMKELVERMTKTMAVQNDKFERLAEEVDTMKRNVSGGSSEQSERIKQLEAELEAAKAK